MIRAAGQPARRGKARKNILDRIETIEEFYFILIQKRHPWLSPHRLQTGKNARLTAFSRPDQEGQRELHFPRR
ncbi:hypothetical protein [Bordetella trematum]|uniref:hypothetical protein n=1 Tax=Bordetella trematum TaxID=123899 RepID=UPI0013FDD7A5|nr:hypothetical protein [Bordetella trematum]